MKNQFIIIISTDPSTGRGGVAKSVPYLALAIKENDGMCKALVTHDHTPFLKMVSFFEGHCFNDMLDNKMSFKFC